MNKSRAGRCARAIVCACLVATLAACGGGGSGGGDTSAPATTTTTTPASPPSSPSLSPQPARITQITLNSDPGDFVGASQQYEYDLTNAQITVSASGALLRVSVLGDKTWNGDFQLPSGLNQLVPGTYSGVTRDLGGPTSTATMDWSGDGRGCGTLTATLSINSVRYDGAALGAVNLDFEMHCEGATPALHGHLAWDASDPPYVGAPENPIPTSLWTAPASALPATGNAMYFVSDPGDTVGQGGTWWVNTNPAGTGASGPSTPGTVVVTGSGNQIGVVVSAGNEVWSGQFVGMLGQPQLQVGYYADLGHVPINNPVRGGLSWEMDGGSCNTANGWFAIDGISYEDGQLVSVDMRFAQYCGGSASGLHGRIRWSNAPTAPQSVSKAPR